MGQWKNTSVREVCWFLFCLVTIAGGPWTSHLTFASQVSSSGYEIRGRSKASHALKFDPTYKAKFYSKASLRTIYCSVSDFFFISILSSEIGHCFFFNLFIFNWGIIALQYCVGLCHTSISHC